MNQIAIISVLYYFYIYEQIAFLLKLKSCEPFPYTVIYAMLSVLSIFYAY